jgi:transposase
MNNTTTITIDLAKEVFQVAIFDKHGKLLLNKGMKEKKMLEVILKHPEAYIFMEACGSAHYWGRRFTQGGYKVGLIPPHFVSKFRSGNKSDKNDAVAIYDASKSTKLHCVPIKTLEQQDLTMLHKQREGYKKTRNQMACRIRGFAQEYGVTFPLGIKPLMKKVPEALENADNELTPTAREGLFNLYEQLIYLIEALDEATQRLETYAKTIEPIQRLVKLPGFGWLGASMMYAKFGTGECFRHGRDASASLGIVPAHSGSGGSVRIGRITKRGDIYFRSLAINGARAVVCHAKDKTDGLSCWIRKLLTTKSFNTVVVAVANKLIRMAFAMLKSGTEYRQPVAQS